jgi:hypothetical protein
MKWFKWWIGPLALLVWIIFTLILFLLGGGSKALGAEVELEWDASISPNISHYVLNFGESELSNKVTVGAATYYKLSGLKDNTLYLFAVQAVNDLGLSSELSNILVYTTPPPPATKVILTLQKSVDLTSWEDVSQVEVSMAGVKQFFRLKMQVANQPQIP